MANTQSNDTLTGILNAMNLQAPSLTGAESQAPSPPPTTASELDKFLYDWQKQEYIASQTWDSYFEGEGTAGMDRIRQQVMPEEPLPKPPSLVEQFGQYRADYGLDALEQSLADLKAEEREQQAIRRERISGTYQERTRASAIQGQVSEIERQEMQRLDFIGREISYHVDMINSAYNVINLYMQYTQMDWENAKEWWTTKFNANMTIYEQLRGEFESDRDFAQRQVEYQQTAAKANLQIYMDMISSGQLFWDSIDSATKTQITKLEAQSGLGIGFLSKIEMDPDKQIKSITTRTSGGTQYADILRVDPKTGALSVETVKLGSVTIPSGGGGGGGKAKEEINMGEEITTMRNTLRLKSGKDTFVSPNTWNALRQEWQDQGYDVQLFEREFFEFINLEHQNKFGGYKTLGNPKGETGAYSRV